MRTADRLRPLANSLAALDWTRGAITQHLTMRLPARLQRHAAGMAKALRDAFPKYAASDARQILRQLPLCPGAPEIMRFIRRTGDHIPERIEPPRFLPAPAFASLDLPQITTPAALAEWLAITPEELTRFADLNLLSARATNPFGGHYRRHLIPKRDGRLRLIEEPKPFLKRLQRRLLAGLIGRIPPHDAAHGFVRGRSCIGAASKHAGEQLVVSFDLADFFPATGFHRIYGLFRAVGYPAAVARHLAGLCTTAAPDLTDHQIAARDHLIGRHLPQGAPTSPALANLVAYRLDVRLAGLADRLQANYTRYADDLTFSGDAHIAKALHDAVPRIVTEEGFHLKPAKTRQSPAHNRQLVTGIVVNEGLSTPREARDRLKATLHHLSNPADPRRADPAFMASLSGQISWVEQVAPHHGARFRAAFEAL